MKITTIKATQIELTPAIEEYVTKKLEAIVNLVEEYGEAASVDVEVGKTSQHHHKGHIFRCEMNLHIPGKVVRAEETAEDLYAAVDAVKDELRRQVKQYKDRQSDAHKHESRPDKQ